jgi:hypothetical protein
MTTHLRGFIAATLMSTATWSALAQAPVPARPASGAASAAPAFQPASGSGYRSAFDDYRRFEEQKVLPWRESNDLVGRIGGWQAYARESAGGDAMPGSHDMPKPASGGAQTAPMPAAAASKPTPSPHGGHPAPKTP